MNPPTQGQEERKEEKLEYCEYCERGWIKINNMVDDHAPFYHTSPVMSDLTHYPCPNEKRRPQGSWQERLEIILAHEIDSFENDTGWSKVWTENLKSFITEVEQEAEKRGRKEERKSIEEDYIQWLIKGSTKDYGGKTDFNDLHTKAEVRSMADWK